MNINNNGFSPLNIGEYSTANTQAVSERRPPPPGGLPPGLAEAVSTLDDDTQQELMSMLESFTKEQHDELKAALDNLKPAAESIFMFDRAIARSLSERLTINCYES